MSTTIEDGKAAMQAKNYTQAIDLFTQALQIFPSSPEVYIQMSTAHQRNGDLERALTESEIATKLAFRRERRENICSAQFRRAVVLAALKRWDQAQAALGWAKRGAPKTLMSQIEMHEARVQRELLRSRAPGENGGSAFQNSRPSVVQSFLEQPEVDIPDPPALSAPRSESSAAGRFSPSFDALTVMPASPAQDRRIKQDWFQSRTLVTVSILVRALDPNSVSVEFSPESLVIRFPSNDQSREQTVHLEHLFRPILPEKSSFRVTPTKIEISLLKRDIGFNWPSVTRDAEHPLDLGQPTAPSTSLDTVATTKPPAYPTSNRQGPKNWDQVAKDEMKQLARGQTPRRGDRDTSVSSEVEGKVDEDDEDNSDDGDPANAFFKRLYKKADPDTRRAMMKSYSESMGTSLSTNWGQVGKAPVPVQPPDGMEEKRYNQ